MLVKGTPTDLTTVVKSVGVHLTAKINHIKHVYMSYGYTASSYATARARVDKE